MRITKICVIGVLGASLVSGCGASSSKEATAVKSMATKSPQPIVETKTPAMATVMDITKTALPEKPEVARVVIALDKKASYSTSREGNQLIIEVFGAKMKSSITQLDVRDPVIKSITAKQIGTSVKSVIELVEQDVAYKPSTEMNPFRILIDVWQISAKTALKQPVGEKERGAAVTSAPALKVDPVRSPAPEPPEAQRTKETTVDARGTPKETAEAIEKPAKEPVAEAPSLTASPQDVPAQLQWFSEKLSQVLQEREKSKQDLLEAEKNFAVKDSMIQVLERKVKEANTRIVELEEELIKIKSKTSLAEQNEKTRADELFQLLTQLEKALGETGAADVTQKEPSPNRAETLVAKITALQQDRTVLGETKGEVETLKTQIAAVTQERDDLQNQITTCSTEMSSLKDSTAKLVTIEKEFRVKEVELSRLREAIGAAAQLVTGRAAETPGRTVQPEIQAVQPETSAERQIAVQPEVPPMKPETSETEGNASEQAGNAQLMLADLLQKQKLSTGSTEDYVLGPGDVVQIKVLKEENLDKTVTVSPDGFITYPLLGDLRVDGLTITQAKAQITSLLARDFLVDPQVVVDVIKQRSKKAYIMGAVKQPGYYEITGDQRLLGTLLNAGGPTSFNTEARVLRLPKGGDNVGEGPTDTMAPIVVDLYKLFEQGDQTQNIVLRDGDVLMVAEKAPAAVAAEPGEKVNVEAQQIYVVGSVVSPGVYTYKPNDTALDAILRAGGFTEFASRNSTKLVREAGGKTQTFRLQMKDVMENGEMDKNMKIVPGDMIIVPESWL